MNAKEILGYVLLAGAVVATGGGALAMSDGVRYGWAILVGGVVLGAVAFRTMTARRA